MTHRKRVIDFDRDVVDGKSALEAYRTILNTRDELTIIHEGREVGLDGVLREESFPEWGFREGVLPTHIRNVSMRPGGNQIKLSYDGQLNQALEEQYWKGRGFSTQTQNKSLRVLDEEGNTLARYGLTKMSIPIAQLDRVIEEMR